jgi:Na+-translocating ferredoxin:NAD+ oxidoreductase RnfG subunit
MNTIKWEKPKKTACFLLISFVIIAAMSLCPGCKSFGLIQGGAYTPGLYRGTGYGYKGQIQVQVQLSSAGIEDISIINHKEGAYPGLAAIEELMELVLESGSTDLDAISGATFSSRGFLDAVDDALEKATAKKRIPVK